MSLHIVENNIVKMSVDAIVNSTNMKMIGHSGVDELIHDIGGPEFEKECRALEGMCKPGEAVHTNAYNLDCKYIIHTVSLPWHGGYNGETAILRNCYRSSLELATELGCQTAAFPLICSGTYSYPIADALKVAVTSINEYLELYSDIDVYLVLYGDSAKRIAESIYGDLDKHIADTYTPAAPDKAPNLDALLAQHGETFVEMLYRFMAEKGIDKPAELYKPAGITKGAYSKLVSGVSKRPSIETAVSLAMALKLSYDEAVEFFASAGLALSNSSKFDIIVGYYLKNGNYDIWDLDVQLVKYGYKSLLGC